MWLIIGSPCGFPAPHHHQTSLKTTLSTLVQSSWYLSTEVPLWNGPKSRALWSQSVDIFLRLLSVQKHPSKLTHLMGCTPIFSDTLRVSSPSPSSVTFTSYKIINFCRDMLRSDKLWGSRTVALYPEPLTNYSSACELISSRPYHTLPSVISFIINTCYTTGWLYVDWGITRY